MSALENLPPDQRAVLQMVLQRGRSYEEIAGLLSIEPAAVRQRALDAFQGLAPASVLPGPESGLITDYLLRQLPERVAEQVHAYLQASEADRVWAEAVADAVAPLASGALPEIPVGAPLGADDWPAGALEPTSDSPRDVAEQPSPPAAVHEEEDFHGADQQPPAAADLAGAGEDPWGNAGSRSRPASSRDPRPSSRRGGAILLSTIGVVIIAVVVVIALTSGGAKQRVGGGSTGPPAQNAGTTVTTTTTATTATTPVLLAQINLKSPNGAASTLGVAQVIREQGVTGVVILAQGVPANTAHNAYAVWLYTSANRFKFVGFVRNLVTRSGKLSAEGELPAGAGAYHRLLITLETQSKPSTPGEVVLSGPFREHP
jgi:hypothetical protein